ncbi:LLM class flavin-dependent oxidoreductase [Streptomyces sp. NPDC002523]
MNHRDQGAWRHKFTSPNFRHPVTLAKELISLDDISGGRITLGIGAGGTGFDATALGQEPWTPRERADRFAEFVPLLDRLRAAPPAALRRGGHRPARPEARRAPRAGLGHHGRSEAVRERHPGAVGRGAARTAGQAVRDLRRGRTGHGGAGQDPAPRLHPGPRPAARVPGRLRGLRGPPPGAGLHRDRDPLAHPGLRLRRRREGLRADRHGGALPAVTRGEPTAVRRWAHRLEALSQLP